MDERLRTSVPARLVASGFILIILMGNFWMIRGLLGQSVPGWFADVFYLTALWTMGNGIWFFVKKANLPKDPV